MKTENGWQLQGAIINLKPGSIKVKKCTSKRNYKTRPEV